MSDIIDSMARYIDNIPDGAVHTCSDLCIKAPCLIVRAKQEIERLRKLIDGAAETGEIYERRLSECEAENDRLRTLLREAGDDVFVKRGEREMRFKDTDWTDVMFACLFVGVILIFFWIIASIYLSI